MSEEEIIERLTNRKKYSLIEIIRKFKREGIENFLITKPELVQGLLDLYNKEKQENKKLKTLLYQLRNEIKWNIFVKEDGIYKPCKNLTKQEVYESYAKLKEMLRANNIFIKNEEAIEELLKEGE